MKIKERREYFGATFVTFVYFARFLPIQLKLTSGRVCFSHINQRGWGHRIPPAITLFVIPFLRCTRPLTDDSGGYFSHFIKIAGEQAPTLKQIALQGFGSSHESR